MNQCKLEVSNRRWQKVNIDISGISEVKWTGMSDFNSDDHYTYYCAQESLRRNGVALIVKKRIRNAELGCNLKKQQNDLCSFPRQTIQYQSNPSQVYAPTTNAKEGEVEWIYDDLQDLLELTPKTDFLFIIGDWNAKEGSQDIPRVTDKFSLGVQKEAGQRLTEFCHENTLVIANTHFKKHKRQLCTPDITRWSIVKSD